MQNELVQALGTEIPGQTICVLKRLKVLDRLPGPPFLSAPVDDEVVHQRRVDEHLHGHNLALLVLTLWRIQLEREVRVGGSWTNEWRAFARWEDTVGRRGIVRWYGEAVDVQVNRVASTERERECQAPKHREREREANREADRERDAEKETLKASMDGWSLWFE